LAKAKASDTIVFLAPAVAARSPRHRTVTTRPTPSFLLGHFEPSRPGSRKRNIDDEVFVWLQQANKKGVKVVFVRRFLPQWGNGAQRERAWRDSAEYGLVADAFAQGLVNAGGEAGQIKRRPR
jgi:hypothetical protein